MRLANIIHSDSIIPELKATDRNGVVRELVQSLADHGAIPPGMVESFVSDAIARENKGSTGFGLGVAVPHVQNVSLDRILATIGRSSQGVDFSAMDRAPVYTVFLLLSPAQAPEQHVGAMERIFRYLKRQEFRGELRRADTVESIVDLIRRADEKVDD